jgi:hypothetical protein
MTPREAELLDPHAIRIGDAYARGLGGRQRRSWSTRSRSRPRTTRTRSAPSLQLSSARFPRMIPDESSRGEDGPTWQVR